MSRLGLLLTGALLIVSSACVPTVSEQLTINDDGSGELTVTWFVTRDMFEQEGFLDRESGTQGLDWTEFRELVTETEPAEAAGVLVGIPDYRPPRRADLDATGTDERVAVTYTERFSSLNELASWKRPPTTDVLAPADAETGRLSLLALWGLEVDRTENGTTTLVIAAGEYWRRYLDAEFGEQGPPNEGIQLEMTVVVGGVVGRHNATRVDENRYIWEPTLGDLSDVDPITISWTATPDDADGGIDTRTVALGLLGVGGLIGIVHLLRWRRH